MSTKHILFAFFIVFFAGSAFAQVTEEWVARYNGPPNGVDQAYDVVCDSEGNVYVTGKSRGVDGNNDCTTVKYNWLGNTVWIARYDGSGCTYSEGVGVAVDSAGNVYVGGRTYWDTSGSDYHAIKYDSEGNELWVATYNGPHNDNEFCADMVLDRWGNAHLTGYSENPYMDFCTVKFDPDGNLIWAAFYDSPYGLSDRATSIAVDPQGNIAVAGHSDTPDNYCDYTTAKYDSLGNLLWAAQYDGTGHGSDYLYDIAMDIGGNVYVTGMSEDTSGHYDYATLKYRYEGNQLLWVARYDNGGTDQAWALALDRDANVYVTGNSWAAKAGPDVGTVKYDRDGNELWVARYHGPDQRGDGGVDVAVGPRGSAYVTGYSYRYGTYYDYDYITIRYDAGGNEIWTARYNGTGEDYDYAQAVAVDADANVYVTGYSPGAGTDEDYLTIMYSQPGEVELLCDKPNWPICKGKFLYFSVTYVNNTGASIRTPITFSAYSDYGCDPSNVLAEIERTRNIPTGTNTYYHYFKLPGGAQPGEYSVSVSFEYEQELYLCCMNADIINCSPWKGGENPYTRWELVEVDREEFETSLPTATELYHNYPNPFNATTQISYILAEASDVKVTIHNLRGQLIETVVDSHQEAGEHQVIWDASDYSSGVYFYKLQAGDYVSTRKMNLLK